MSRTKWLMLVPAQNAHSVRAPRVVLYSFWSIHGAGWLTVYFRHPYLEHLEIDRPLEHLHREGCLGGWHTRAEAARLHVEGAQPLARHTAGTPAVYDSGASRHTQRKEGMLGTIARTYLRKPKTVTSSHQPRQPQGSPHNTCRRESLLRVRSADRSPLL